MKSILEKLNETSLEDLIGKKLSDIGLDNTVSIKKIIKTNISPKSIKKYINSDGNKYPYYNDTVKASSDFEIDESGYFKYTLCVCEFLKEGDKYLLNNYKYVALTDKQIDILLSNSNIKNELIKTVKSLLNKNYKLSSIQKSIKDLTSVLNSNDWEERYNKLYNDNNDLE